MEKIKKILVANRGEIACRIFSTCRALGIKTVAVYSDADKNAKHVRIADEAYLIGPGPVSESYLVADKIIEVAKKAKASAIHPGYGLLSERSFFAEKVQKAGLIWIGPNPKAIELLGNKIAAKKIAEKAKVPTLKWSQLTSGWREKDLQLAAKKVGFPLLLKAAAGGGGRGMRLVLKSSELLEKAQAAVREAEGSFGSGEIFLESYCEKARHIEVQVLGDQKGNVFIFGERECSAQRRHQKVIEEAPAANLSEKTRKSLWAAAKRLAQEVKYSNAGTCEFLVDFKENFYFLEMNTRLQVEHPVTELVWGIDLVSLQIRVAQGENLQKELTHVTEPRGHAIEARLCAEDASNGFMPSPGVLDQVSFAQETGIRVDTGYETKDEIPPFYDSMFAKMISWSMTREEARTKLLFALSRSTVVPIHWNKQYLIDILAHKKFIDSTVYTKFLEEAFKNWKPATANESIETELKEKIESPKILSAFEYFGDETIRNLSKKTRKQGSNQSLSDLPTGPLVSQYPGKVLKVLVKPGQRVSKGEVLVVCESMKMEFSYSAPFETKLKTVLVQEGQMIPAGKLLVEWEEKVSATQ
ncbi:MAG: biotin carboxylase N-terminal domain-containing protein [Bacteriovoracia bacterium]